MSPLSNSDRLSHMPDEILHHILSFLPTPESVRTSVLSSRWRQLWHCVPAFHFDVLDLLRPANIREFEPEDREAAENINQFIARRDAACPLLRFHLHVPWIIDNRADPVSDWISYAKSHGVRDMSVHIFSAAKRFPLSTFFDLPSIEALDLQHFCFVRPCMFPQLIVPCKLKSLTLNLPSPSLAGAKFLAAFVHSCPDLQELTLYRGPFNQVVEITAPNLRRLSILDGKYWAYQDPYQVKITCPKLEYMHLSTWVYLRGFQGKIASLPEASIDLSYVTQKCSKQFKHIFMSLRSVTKLTLRLKPDIKVKTNLWCVLEHITGFPIFHKLKRLKFSADISKDYIKQILLYFFMRAPNLSSLDIIHLEQLDTTVYSPLASKACKLRIRASLKASDHLKVVSVKEISDEEIQSDVLKMLSEHVKEWQRVAVIT